MWEADNSSGNVSYYYYIESVIREKAESKAGLVYIHSRKTNKQTYNLRPKGWMRNGNSKMGLRSGVSRVNKANLKVEPACENKAHLTIS